MRIIVLVHESFCHVHNVSVILYSVIGYLELFPKNKTILYRCLRRRSTVDQNRPHRRWANRDLMTV